MLVGLFLIGCQSKVSKETLISEIKQAEEALYADEDQFKFEDSIAERTIRAYEKYAEAFPEDSVSAEYLFKAADVYRALKRYPKALEIYSDIQKKFPDHSRVPYTYFLQGFVYENELMKPNEAKPFYETFLEKYPDHALARDVAFSLEFLGKSPEEIIKSFDQKTESDTVL